MASNGQRIGAGATLPIQFRTARALPGGPSFLARSLKIASLCYPEHGLIGVPLGQSSALGHLRRWPFFGWAMISQKAIDLIVMSEVSSRDYYDKVLHHPEWPGGVSGVTVGIGYDLGYCTVDKLRTDWDGKLPDATISIMERCVGVTGSAAQRLLPSVKSQIDVPWDAAMAVFLQRDIPQWTDTVIKHIPAAQNLSPDSLGALISLAYNRGASFDNQGQRYREMRDIKAHIQAGELSKVPDDFRAMKRLWPNMRGLRIRRDAEAQLFQDGLNGKIVPPQPTQTTSNT